MDIFDKLKKSLSKTRTGITDRIEQLVSYYKNIDDDFFEELEEILITADVGVQTTLRLVEDIEQEVRAKKIGQSDLVKELLKGKMLDILRKGSDGSWQDKFPKVLLIVGVNGVGKTTTIGKLAKLYKDDGRKVLLAAADTFRAAAIEQLEVWGQRVGAEVIKQSKGSDPGAVVFDAVHASKSRKADVLICDTAGRLHNKKNLMEELKKINRIIDREWPEANKEVLLVLDATTGQNAISQAKTFKEAVDISGIILTKLDGTAKGGIVIGINSELNIPVRMVGTGEGVEDLQPFDAQNFVEALFS
ncbi:MAG TPA: signal recognition particle-docking protein FtsY [Clostridiales bacterium]|nr:signal recognition particle-docking protein FtsY [Clostridiales bacterium]